MIAIKTSIQQDKVIKSLFPIIKTNIHEASS
jgi:hypothetical protein